MGFYGISLLMFLLIVPLIFFAYRTIGKIISAGKLQRRFKRFEREANDRYNKFCRLAEGLEPTLISLPIAPAYDSVYIALIQAGKLDTKGKGSVALGDLRKLALKAVYREIVGQRKELDRQKKPGMGRDMLVLCYLNNLLFAARMGGNVANLEMEILQAANLFRVAQTAQTT